MKKGAVLMIYNLPPEALALVKKHNIRAGLKGYPSNTEEALKMIDSASEMGLEMVCISEHLIDENLLAYAKKSDIWLLPWTASKPKPERWQKMVDWGAGGLITAWVGWSTENLKAY